MNASSSNLYKDIFKAVDELSEDAQEKARAELGETPEKVLECPGKLRELILKKATTDSGKRIENLFGDKSDRYLLRFLRARKYNVEQAYSLIEGYIAFRQKYPELMKDLTAESLQCTLQNGFPGLLPVRDKEGQIVFLFAIGKWDQYKFPFDEVLRAYVFLLEKLLNNADTQVHGFVIIENFKHYSIKQALGMRPGQLKKMVDMLQGAFPARFKGVHFIHQPWYFTWTYALVKPFLRAKLAQRVHVHGHNLQHYLEAFNPNVLPENFGGNAPPYNPMMLVDYLTDGRNEE